MKEHAPARKASRKTTDGPLHHPFADKNMVALVPPAYGIDFVDGVMHRGAPVQRIGKLDEEKGKEPLQGKFDVVPAQLRQSHSRPSPNRTGMPDGLKAGIESLSGMDLSDVRVNFNSDRPTQLSALACAQGNDIHLAPGQEKHLPHEAWHVVQQRQGRVEPTLQLKDGVQINDDQGLEREADVMGAKALQMRRADHAVSAPIARQACAQGVMQLNGNGEHALAVAEAIPSLGELLAHFDTDISLGILNSRPALLKTANKIVNEVKDQDLTQTGTKLRLIELGKTLSQWLSGVADAGGLTGDKKRRYSAVQRVTAQIHAHVGSSAQIAAAVAAQSGAVEHGAAVADFPTYFTQKHPDLIEIREDGEPRLKGKDAGATFEREQVTWKAFRDQQRPQMRADASQMNASEKWIARIVNNTYPQYQDPLRAAARGEAADTFEEKGNLLQVANIVAAFSNYAPETVTKVRYATKFPSGITDPAALVTGQTYVEPGFAFIGGERPADEGYKMSIKMTKGYPVDARGYYGHRSASESKMQWLSLPGAGFKYLGKDGETYKFEQVSR